MKILITGCTAPQTSKKISNKIPTFSSTIQDILSEDHEVELIDPSKILLETVEKYDAVFVGLAPLTSVVANKIYPAFVLANRARSVGNLILTLDAPEPHKIQASINSYKAGKVDLLKKFYSKRKNYDNLVSDKNFRKEFFSFVNFLSDEEWPIVIHPSLPWQGSSVVFSSLPNVDRSNTLGVHIDAYLMPRNDVDYSIKTREVPYWVCDALTTKWSRGAQQTLSYTTLPMKTREDSPESIEERVDHAVAALVSVYRSEDPWWSPLLSKALNVGVPVLTEWRYSSILGESWSRLGSEIEEMSAKERLSLAIKQKESYLKSINDKKTTLEQIESAIKELR
jgi:hypothetical protein